MQPLSPESALSERAANQRRSPGADEDGMVARTRARDATSLSRTSQVKDQNERGQQVGKLAGVVIEQKSQSKKSGQQRVAQQPRTSGRGSRPVSPPYSPDDDSEEIESRTLDESESTQHLNILTPQREDAESGHKSPRRSERQRGKPNDGSAEDDKSGPNEAHTNRSPPPGVAADSGSAPSSVNEHRSNETAEESPETSPDGERQQTTDNADDADGSQRDGPVQKIVKDSTVSGVGQDVKNEISTSALIATEDRSDVAGSDQVHKTASRAQDHHAGRNALSTLEANEQRFPTKMDIDEQAHAQASNQDVQATQEPPSSVSRGRKRKRTLVSHQSKYVVYKPRSERFVATTQALQENIRETRQSQTANTSNAALLKGGYMSSLALRAALKSAYTPDLEHAIKNTSKTVSTGEWMTLHREDHTRRVFERILHLQHTGRWSLRQPKRSVEPPPQALHWDAVLHDVKWLRTDYREERKLKIEVAKEMADACAKWVAASPEVRKQLQSRSALPTSDKPLQNSMEEVEGPFAPEENSVFVFSGQSDSVKLFDSTVPYRPEAGAKCCLNERILKHIPELRSSLYVAGDAGQPGQEHGEAAASLPFTLEKNKQPSVRHYFREILRSNDEPVEPSATILPEETSCALFDPEWRSLRTRLNQQWPWKPPSNTMPPQSYYELRHASQWTNEDDAMLRQFVKESPSNWNLISDRMNSKTSVFKSNIERRTPWECYERLLSMELAPNDAQARQYLRPFTTRLEKAQVDFLARQKELQTRLVEEAKHHESPQAITNKRFPTPMKVDKKPTKRFLALLDASRKLARKRENTILKQQQNAQQQEGMFLYRLL